jgi:hypothetical protein
MASLFTGSIDSSTQSVNYRRDESTFLDIFWQARTLGLSLILTALSRGKATGWPQPEKMWLAFCLMEAKHD